MSLSAHHSFFKTLAPAGFYVALRIGYACPQDETQELPTDWVETYNRRGFLVTDPMMRWFFGNTGAVRLSALGLPDPDGVLDFAASLGMRYGAVAAVTQAGSALLRSYATLFRDDREMTDGELRRLTSTLQTLHNGSALPRLTKAEAEALTLQARGLRMKQIAAECGITESAVKARLKGAQRKLGAKTTSEMLSIATSRRLI